MAQETQRRWAPPPFALVELLTGKPLAAGIGLKELGQMFSVRGELLYAPHPSHPTMLDLLTSPRFKPQLFESVEAAVGAAISDWAPNDRVVQQRCRKMFDQIRSDVSAERFELVLSLLLPPEADLVGAVAEQEPGTGLKYIDYAHPRIDGRFITGAARFDDPRQFCWSDCYLITSIISMCWVDPDGMLRRLQGTVRDADKGLKRWHAWTPFDLITGAPAAEVQVDGELPFSDQGDRLFARSTQASEFWPAVMEKIFVLVIDPPSIDRDAAGRGPARKRYRKINFGVPRAACRRLFGGEVGGVRTTDENVDLAAVLRDGHEDSGRELLDASGKTLLPTMAWTLDADDARFTDDMRRRYEDNFISHSHAYAVLGRMTRGRAGHVVLREPRCDPLPSPLPANWVKTGTWKLRPGTKPVDEVELNSKGIFALREDVFAHLFAGLDWGVVPGLG